MLPRESHWRPHGVVTGDAVFSGAGQFLEDFKTRGRQLTCDIERLTWPVASQIKSLRVLPVWEELSPVDDYDVRMHHLLIDSHNHPYRLSRGKL